MAVIEDEDSGAGASASFDEPELNAEPCEFKFKLPSFTFGFTLPPIKFPPFEIPIPRLRLALSCDLSKPIDVSAGLEFGGGRVAEFDPSPDDDPNL